MNKAIFTLAVATLSTGLNAAWAGDTAGASTKANAMEAKQDHMQQMHEHMGEMQKSMDMGKGDTKCEMKSDGKCDAKNMTPANKAATDKTKTSPETDEHSLHHQ